MAKKDKPIAAALQIGEPLRLLDGTEIPFLGAAPLKDLERYMELWNIFANSPGLPHIYGKGYEKEREAFEELLYIATGRQMDKEELLSRITAGDATEVVSYLAKFLGLLPITTGNSDEEAEKQEKEAAE
jgi:hypothetical protein